MLTPETWIPCTRPLAVLTVGRLLSVVNWAEIGFAEKRMVTIKRISFFCRIREYENLSINFIDH
jgi:hypothetical protein